jgi:hypothetical protein
MIEVIDPNSQEMRDFYDKKFYFSYSGLNKLLFSPKAFYKHYILDDREERTDAHLVEGSLLHCLLLEPEKFDEKFIISPSKLPTGNNLDIVNKTFQVYSEQDDDTLNLSDFSQQILSILVSINLHQSLKTDEQRLEKILTPENIDYFDFLKARGNRAIIDSAIKIKADESIEYLKADEQVMNLMCLNSPSTFNELELKMDMQGVSFGLKGIVDNVVIDKESETIFVNDLKTISKPLLKFKDTLEFYRYDLQAAIYYTLARQYVKEQFPELTNFKVVFTFIVIDSFNLVYPYQVSQSTMKDWIKNLSDALRAARFHYDNKQYGLPYELASYNLTL